MTTGLGGRLLVASPLLVDPNFFRTVVLLLQHDEEGALGVVLNRPSAEAVADHLPAWAPAVGEPAVVFVGGPVEPPIAIALEASPVPAEPTGVDGVGILDLERDPASTELVRVFSGYAGWGPGQLESELEEDAWVVVDAAASDPFHPDPERLWSEVLRRQGGRLAMLASYPPDPRLN